MNTKKSSNIKAKKSLGQNWLVNQRALDRIVDSAQILKDDIVVEIGPGTGNLTRKLISAGAKVIAIEKDHRLIEKLRFDFPSAEFIEGDVLNLETDNLQLTTGNYKIVGNIPYYITSHLIRQIFEKWPRPKSIILTVQKEVAQRMKAKPPKMNLLALSVQFYSDIEIIGYLAPGNFSPPPKVDSAIIRLTPKENLIDPSVKEMFFKLIKAGFSSKRKKLVGNLINNLSYSKIDLENIFNQISINISVRAENIDLEIWLKLAKQIISSKI